MRRFAAIALIVGSAAWTSAAQRNQFRAYGPLNRSCGAFAAATGTDRQILEVWLYGFVSGAGYERSDRGQPRMTDSDPDGLTAWAVKFCTDHPLDQFPAAARALVDELEKPTTTKP